MIYIFYYYLLLLSSYTPAIMAQHPFAQHYLYQVVSSQPQQGSVHPVRQLGQYVQFQQPLQTHVIIGTSGVAIMAQAYIVQMQFHAPQTGSLPCKAVLQTPVHHVRNAPIDNCMRENFTILPGTIIQVVLDPAYPLWACVLLSNGIWKWIGRHHLQ